jgi:molybdate transport system substrate-binding protein
MGAEMNKAMRLLLLCVALVGSSIVPSPSEAAHALVFAAASLKDALDDQVRRFQSSSGHTAAVSYAATPALARQIENGAPADLFISADLEWMDYLATRRLIAAASRIDLLANSLVLIAPVTGMAGVRIVPGFPLRTLLGEGRLAMADPDSVPAGRYGKAALQSLGVWQSVEGRLARAENVRVALALVARAEAPLGIVYRTDAMAEPKVRVAGEFPAPSHPRIVYPAALVAGSKSPAAPALLAWLKSTSARAVWEKHGFSAAG